MGSVNKVCAVVYSCCFLCGTARTIIFERSGEGSEKNRYEKKKNKTMAPVKRSVKTVVLVPGSPRCILLFSLTELSPSNQVDVIIVENSDGKLEDPAFGAYVTANNFYGLNMGV